MTTAQIEALLQSVARGETRARDAIAQLVRDAGYDQPTAEETVFIVLGGGDLVAIDDDGLERYQHSGKLVRDVEAAMAR